MACDLWLVPLVDVLCHSPDNPFAEETRVATTRHCAKPDCRRSRCSRYMPGLSGDVAPVAGFDYDALHFLRRAYLLRLCGLEVTPVDELGGDYEQLLEMFEATGAAVPPGVALRPRGRVRADGLRRAAWSTTNSSPAAARWAPATGCCASWSAVAPAIGIDPANPPLAPAPPQRPTELEEPALRPIPYDNSPFARERHVWLGLHAAATRSLAQGSMIVFS